MKIFLSVSYSSQVDSEGIVLAPYRTQLEEVIETLESRGHHVFCAPREDGWKLNHASPAEAYLLDVAHIDVCDVFIALVSSTISGGIQAEIGIATTKGKRVILASSDPLGYFNQGAVDAGHAAFIAYGSHDELVGKMGELTASFSA